jgi:hypothetical protein
MTEIQMSLKLLKYQKIKSKDKKDISINATELHLIAHTIIITVKIIQAQQLIW